VITFSSSREKWQYCHPPELQDISIITARTILGASITNHLAVSEHVTGVITKYAQSLYAHKILRCHGTNDEAQGSCAGQDPTHNPCMVGIH